jgi:hypothetical protein
MVGAKVVDGLARLLRHGTTTSEKKVFIEKLEKFFGNLN